MSDGAPKAPEAVKGVRVTHASASGGTLLLGEQDPGLYELSLWRGITWKNSQPVPSAAEQRSIPLTIDGLSRPLPPAPPRICADRQAAHAIEIDLCPLLKQHLGAADGERRG